MKDLRQWIGTLSLAGLAVAALILAIRPALAVPTQGKYAECVFVNTSSNPNMISAMQIKHGKFLEGVAAKQPMLMNGWTPELWTPHGLMMCR